MDPQDRTRITTITGSQISQVSPMSGGCIAPVYLVSLADGTILVAKQGEGLETEAWMLDHLAKQTGVPVPHLIHVEAGLLLMEYIPADGSLDAHAQIHAADLLAGLHAITAPTYGGPCEMTTGGLPLPNPASPLWLPFFTNHRLLFMADLAHQAGHLSIIARHRIDTIAGRLGQWLDEPECPGLIHGDLWHGNILCRRTAKGNRIAAFIDPSINYADPEIELAYATLFDSLGAAFFDRYQQHRSLSPGFIEVKRDLYNLYPLLVHVRLFAGHYPAAVDRILDRFGC
ncbi:MAG: fructosamine kinase family protein [Alphaproteobacteria bacterium]